MELPLQRNREEIKSILEMNSFNPCFNGTTSATFYGQSSIEFSVFVSILVLMELPLQPCICSECWGFIRVSILVLMELPLQRSTNIVFGAVYEKFQSLF